MSNTNQERTKEVRFAVVMYGGGSLAIYINGIAQEFLKLALAVIWLGLPVWVEFSGYCRRHCAEQLIIFFTGVALMFREARPNFFLIIIDV
jgi:hypothetical protein